MKKAVLAGISGVVIALAFFGGFASAIKFQQPRIEAQVVEVQAMQWFNHLTQFQDLELTLSKGCASETQGKIAYAIDKELELLASFEKERPGTWVDKYIADRNPGLLNQLKTFKSKYGNSWTEPKCEK